MFKILNFKDSYLLLAIYFSLLALTWNLPGLGSNLMPRNFMGWFAIGFVVFLIFAGVLLKKEDIKFSSLFFLLLIPPISFVVHGTVFSPNEASLNYYIWLASFSTLGFAFLMASLFQIDETSKVWPKISSVFLYITFLQVLMSELVAKTSFGSYLYSFLPLELAQLYGGFQQKNLMATFASAVVLWNWALLLQDFERYKKQWMKLLLITVPLLLIIFSVGSAAAGYALLFGSIIFLFGSYRKNSFSRALIFFALVVGSYFLIRQGVAGSDKVDSLLVDSNVNIRLVIWHISILAGLDEPLWGHGLTNFSLAYYAKYIQLHDTFEYWSHVQRLGHPHNEILMHWVEMGLYGLLLVVLPIVYFFIKVVFRYSTNAYFLIGSLSPVALHSMVEMPLHASGAHWLLTSLIVASLTTRVWLKNVRLPSLSLIPILVSSFAACILAVDLAITSSDAWTNFSKIKNIRNVQDYIQTVNNGDILSHWVMGGELSDNAVKFLTLYSIQSGNISAVRELLPRLLLQMNRTQDRESWPLVAQSYLLLGKPQEYKKHILNIKAFDPDYAIELDKIFSKSL